MILPYTDLRYNEKKRAQNTDFAKENGSTQCKKTELHKWKKILQDVNIYPNTRKKYMSLIVTFVNRIYAFQKDIIFP